MTSLHAVCTTQDGRYAVAWSDGLRVLRVERGGFLTPRAAIDYANSIDPSEPLAMRAAAPILPPVEATSALIARRSGGARSQRRG